MLSADVISSSCSEFVLYCIKGLQYSNTNSKATVQNVFSIFNFLSILAQEHQQLDYFFIYIIVMSNDEGTRCIEMERRQKSRIADAFARIV